MKCFHHNDMDGRCAGSLVSIVEKNNNQEDFISLNYDAFPIDKIEKDELVYIVDLSFSKNTEKELRAIMEKTSNLIWIDHHQSSIDLINEHPEFEKIKGIRRVGICGALLTYLYTHDLLDELDNNDEIEVPDYLLYVDDHDCWKKNIEDSKYFFLGISSTDHDALDSIWKDFYTGNFEVYEFVNKGKTIWNYLEKTYEMVRQSGYEVDVDGAKAFVVNYKGNSWVFGDLITKYDLVILWQYNGDKYSYSFYSDEETSGYDCKALAEKYGGGGHPGSSGCKSSELLFKKKN